MSALLQTHVLRKAFGAKTVLQDTALKVGRGEIVALVGPSGCGKSTLLRIVAGLEKQYSGSVHFDGRKLRGLNRAIGFIFQEPRLFPWLSVAQNIAFDLGEGGAAHPRVAELLDEVGLSGFGDALPKQLSGGQAQRASIARGLFTQPQLLLLDEPFSAVDAFTRMKLQDLLIRIAQQHSISLLLVTHDVDEALYLADRVLVMSCDPGFIHAEFHVPVARPRDRRDDALAHLKSEVLTELYAVHAI